MKVCSLLIIDSENGFMHIMFNCIDDVYLIASLVPRVQDESDNYLTELKHEEELEELKDKVIERVHAVMEECEKYKESYEQFSYLWTESRQDFMTKFLSSDSDDADTNTNENEM